MIDKRLISIDLETSSSDKHRGVILSVGAEHIATGETYYSEIGYKGPIPVDAESSEVHKMDLSAAAMKGRPSLGEVDKEFRLWLENATGIKKQWKLVPIGLNVATFDIEFMRWHMPKSVAMFGYRSADLNAMLFLVDYAYGRPLGTTKNKIKKLTTNDQPHNALEDAKQAAEIFRYLADNFIVKGDYNE